MLCHACNLFSSDFVCRDVDTQHIVSEHAQSMLKFIVTTKLHQIIILI